MRRDIAICAGLILITLAAYWQVWAFDFVKYDDVQYVNGNWHVREGLSWENVAWAFTTGTASNWHPLTWLSHMLDVQLFGLRSGAHHAINLVFHAANTLLLFFVFRRMTGAVWKSAMLAALFAIHPLHVESVAWVAERKDVLSTFLGLLTLAAYVSYARKPGPGRYVLVFMLFVLALMAKPMLVTLPFVFLLLDYWPLERLISASTARRLALEKLPLLIPAVASCVVTWIMQQRAMAPIEIVPFTARIQNALLAYVRYLDKTLWPINLALPYPFEIKPDSTSVLTAAVVLIGITAFVIWAWKRQPYLAVGWFWYWGTLVPVIGIVQVGIQGMADRYTYIPLIGIFVMATWGLAELLASWDRRHLVLPAIGIVVLGACVLRTRNQVQYWCDTEKLFLHTIDVMPRNILAHNTMCALYDEQGKTAESIAQAEATLQIEPRNAIAHTQLAVIAIEQKRWDEAADHLKIALQTNPSFATAHNHYGLVLLAKGDTEGAIQHLNEAVRLDPENTMARGNLARTCFAMGKLDEAAKQWREVLQLNSRSAEAASSLAAILQKQGKTAEAIGFYRRSLDSDPANADIRNNLAVALITAGKTDEALAQWRELIRLQPDDAVALNAIAWIQATSSDPTLLNGKEAVQMAEKALQLSKEQSPEMLDTLAASYAEAGQYAEAIATASKAADLASSAGKTELAGQIRARLQNYQNNKPYREPPER